MEEKKDARQLKGLSDQLMEMYVANLLSKHNVDIEKAKLQITKEQRAQLRKTAEQLKAQVDEYLESKKTQKMPKTEEKNAGQVNPLREAFIQRRMNKERGKNE
ncbi:hypothetical protein NSQ43_15530 [Sporosarcina sp. FSL W8-0480]|uniref:hypothetical protein n=1 Tax=Sporosarcina sp. FSL W8-0480 TaxID=2954701 RepID=UPI0030DB57AF